VRHSLVQRGTFPRLSVSLTSARGVLKCSVSRCGPISHDGCPSLSGSSGVSRPTICIMDSCLGRRGFRSQFRRLIKIYFYVVCHRLWVGLAVCVGSVGYVVGIHGWVRVQGLGGLVLESILGVMISGCAAGPWMSRVPCLRWVSDWSSSTQHAARTAWSVNYFGAACLGDEMSRTATTRKHAHIHFAPIHYANIIAARYVEKLNRPTTKQCA